MIDTYIQHLDAFRGLVVDGYLELATAVVAGHRSHSCSVCREQPGAQPSSLRRQDTMHIHDTACTRKRCWCFRCMCYLLAVCEVKGQLDRPYDEAQPRLPHERHLFLMPSRGQRKSQIWLAGANASQVHTIMHQCRPVFSCRSSQRGAVNYVRLYNNTPPPTAHVCVLPPFPPPHRNREQLR